MSFFQFLIPFSFSLSHRQLFLYIPNLPSFSPFFYGLFIFYLYYFIIIIIIIIIGYSIFTFLPTGLFNLNPLHRPFKLPFSLDPTVLLFSRFSFHKKATLGLYVNQPFLLSGISL